MARSAKSDPIRNFKFQVTINASGGLGTYTQGLDKIGFAAMSGLSVNNEMVGYREGGMNTHPHKFVGQSDFAPVTFSRGVFANQAQMYKWQQFMHAWNQGEGGIGGSSPADYGYRCDIFVKVFDHPNSSGQYSNPESVDGVAPRPGSARFGFKLFNCWPGAYSLSDLNAGDSGIMVQQLTVHHEGFVVGWDEAQVAQIQNLG
jgi:phage tail-like protein